MTGKVMITAAGGEGLRSVAIEPKQIPLPLTQKVNPLSNCDGDEYAMSDQG
jgi:hypothetical protein